MGHAFTYDISAGIPAVIQEDGIYYVREPAGELIARLGGPNMNHYHFDQLGSTRLLTNSGGAVTDEYTYDAYGAVLSHNRSTGSIDQPYQYVGQLGYYTHYQEPNFGLLQLGVRFYDSEVGRFGQRDPISSNANSLYCYSNDAPTTTVDPSGKVCYRCWRDLESSLGWTPWKHSFIWCDVGDDGYDAGDPMIGMGGDSICSDFDRKYFGSVYIGDEYHLHCNKLSDKLFDCLVKRIKKDMGKKCFGKYNPCNNNCQEYSQDMIDDCK